MKCCLHLLGNCDCLFYFYFHFLSLVLCRVKIVKSVPLEEYKVDKFAGGLLQDYVKGRVPFNKQLLSQQTLTWLERTIFFVCSF